MVRKQTSENEMITSGATPARVRRKAVPARRTKQTGAKAADDAEVAQPQIRPAVHEPTYQEIATLAYSYWEARGYTGGSPEEDWVRAERELRGCVAVATA
jgi:hypothetical protein